MSVYEQILIGFEKKLAAGEIDKNQFDFGLRNLLENFPQYKRNYEYLTKENES